MYLISTCTNLGMFVSLPPLVTRTSCLYSKISGFNPIILTMGKPTFLTPIDTRLAASWYLDFPYTLVKEYLSMPLHLPTNNPQPHRLIWTYCITLLRFPNQSHTLLDDWRETQPPCHTCDRGLSCHIRLTCMNTAWSLNLHTFYTVTYVRV